MATFSVKIEPFSIPTEVRLLVPSTNKREDGMRPVPTIKLTDLTDDALNDLIEEFVAGVMKAAGRST